MSHPDFAHMTVADALSALIAAVRRDQAARNIRDVLIPEQDTEWPPGYDFDELEKADEKSKAAAKELEQLLEHLESNARCAERQKARKR